MGWKRRLDTDKKQSSMKPSGLALLIGGGLFAALAISYWLLRNDGIHPAWLIGVAALISIAFPMLRSNFFPSAKDCTAEYDFHEKRLEAQIRQQVAERLGSEDFQRLYSQDGIPRDSSMDHCRELIRNAPARGDRELRFALLLLLARIHENRGDPEKSIQCLKEAINLEPQHFIANFRIAMNYELIGNEHAAVHHYRQALEDPGGLSRAMEKLTVAQMKRIQSTDN